MTAFEVRTFRSAERSNLVELPGGALILKYKKHGLAIETATGFVLDYDHHEVVALCPVGKEKP